LNFASADSGPAEARKTSVPGRGDERTSELKAQFSPINPAQGSATKPGRALLT